MGSTKEHVQVLNEYRATIQKSIGDMSFEDLLVLAAISESLYIDEHAFNYAIDALDCSPQATPDIIRKIDIFKHKDDYSKLKHVIRYVIEFFYEIYPIITEKNKYDEETYNFFWRQIKTEINTFFELDKHIYDNYPITRKAFFNIAIAQERVTSTRYEKMARPVSGNNKNIINGKDVNTIKDLVHEVASISTGIYILDLDMETIFKDEETFSKAMIAQQDELRKRIRKCEQAGASLNSIHSVYQQMFINHDINNM